MNALNVDLIQQEDGGLSPEQTNTSWIRSITMLTAMSLLSIISKPKVLFVCFLYFVMLTVFFYPTQPMCDLITCAVGSLFVSLASP